VIIVHVLPGFNFGDEALLAMQNIKNIDHVYKMENLSKYQIGI
jgi:hypothetical protein